MNRIHRLVLKKNIYSFIMPIDSLDNITERIEDEGVSRKIYKGFIKIVCM